MKKAKHSIYIRIYIWDDAATRTLIADQLIKAAQKNVAVFVIADDYASQCLLKEFIKHLRNHKYTLAILSNIGRALYPN